MIAHLRDHVRAQARPDPWNVVVGRIEMGVDRRVEQQRRSAAAAANAPDRVARRVAHRLIGGFDADASKIVHHVLTRGALPPGRAMDRGDLAVEPIEGFGVDELGGGLKPCPLLR